MKNLLLFMKTAVEQTKAQDAHELDLIQLAQLLCCYDEILVEGYLANPPPGPPRSQNYWAGSGQ